MTIHFLYIFDKHGTLLCYREWNRKKQTGVSRLEEGKLVYGMIYSLKSFISKVSPLDVKEGYFAYSTNKYRLHVYETPTKLKFVLGTDLLVVSIQDLLHKLYTQVYVDYVVLNPMSCLSSPIESDLFFTKVDEVIKSSAAFVSKML